MDLNLLDRDTARSVFDWKVSSWNRLFQEVLSSLGSEFDGKTVLEIGANKGGLSLFFSWLGCKVICSDVTAAYLAKAQDLHRQWDRCCSYLAADLRVLPVRSETIDIVIMKSVLGGIYACAGRETASASLKEIYRVLRKGGCCILLEQLEGDPVSRWVRGRTSPGYEWHYFKSEEFLKPDANLLAKEFQTVSIKCLTLSSYVLEHLFSSDTLLVRGSLIFDRLVEKVIHDDWKHLISVIAMK